MSRSVIDGIIKNCYSLCDFTYDSNIPYNLVSIIGGIVGYGEQIVFLKSYFYGNIKAREFDNHKPIVGCDLGYIVQHVYYVSEYSVEEAFTRKIMHS